MFALSLIEVTLRGQVRGSVDGESHGVAESRGDVHELQAALRARVRELGGGIERGAHDSDRVVEQFDSTFARGRLASAIQRAVGCGVVRDDAVESLRYPLSRRAGELELRFAQLLHARPAVGQVDRARVLRHLPHRQLIVWQPVLAGVRCRRRCR